MILEEHVLLIESRKYGVGNDQGLGDRRALFDIIAALGEVLFPELLVVGVFDQCLEAIHCHAEDAGLDSAAVLAELPHVLHSEVHVEVVTFLLTEIRIV